MTRLLTRVFLFRSPSKHLVTSALISLALVLSGCNGSSDDSGSDEVVISLAAGPDLELRAQEALIVAEPGTVIEFPAGTYDFLGELSVSVPGITIRGQGMNVTMLNFANQQTGGQGIIATGDNFTIEDIAILETPGDGIKAKGIDGVTIRRVRVGWESFADVDNGAYGLYPVQTTNVLIEDSEVYGASDAGVYVGQSRKIIVRRNYVHKNVAGIEIENSTIADVYENETTENTGGILVFDLPNLEITGGESTRLFNNEVYNNNTPNFAPEGNIVGSVPTGTGIMVMANDDIEIFDNNIVDHKTVGITVVSYYASLNQVNDPAYDPVPEKIYIHDNTFANNSTDPQDLIGSAVGGFFSSKGDPMPVIYYDSSGVEGVQLPEDKRICIRDNGGPITAGTFDILVEFLGGAGDVKYAFGLDFFDCSHPSLPEVVLDQPGDIDTSNPNDEAAIAELCGAITEGVNADAYTVNCPNLSDYRLYVNDANPTGSSNGGVKYDLTTPLFTDYAEKYREVFVPEGLTASYRSENAFDFPVGTILVKTFVIQSDHRDANSEEELIETRLLIHREEGWIGLPYIWNQGKTDAVLTLVGGTQSVSWTDSNGDAQMTNYVIPNSNQCKNCHGEGEAKPIGPKARLLNKNFAYASGSANQIEHWTEEGILIGAPAVNTIDTIPNWENTGASLDKRARGYLDINCAHCHNPEGAGNTSGLYLDYNRPVDIEYGLCKPPVAAGSATGNLDYDIVPGAGGANQSIIKFRMNSTNAAIMMPEIGRSVIHTEGVALISQWINNLSPAGCL